LKTPKEKDMCCAEWGLGNVEADVRPVY